jgi:hypothetical protein
MSNILTLLEVKSPFDGIAAINKETDQRYLGALVFFCTAGWGFFFGGLNIYNNIGRFKITFIYVHLNTLIIILHIYKYVHI